MTATAMMQRRAAATIRALCLVPEPMTVTEWADRYRMLPETSASPGRYDSSVTPYARRWMDLGADPTCARMVLCWAAQTTKSTVIENIFGYRICRAPSPMLVVQPKIDAAESWAKERLRPMIAATPALRERVQIGRATESTMRYLRFPGGFLFVASAGSASELASRSTPIVANDEVDRYEIIPGEGNPVEIVSARQGSSDVGLEILTSTPRDAESTIIWPYLEGGTYEFYHIPCPLCSMPQKLEWARLKWEDGRPRECWYICAHCDQPFTDRDKPEWLAAGEWIASNPDGQYPSSHLNGLYSPFAKANWVAQKDKWKRAQGKPADLQVFVNTVLAELWQETGESIDADSLLQRLERFDEDVVPDGAAIVTAGVDVQAGSLHAYLWGWGAGLESWLIASIIIPGDPQREPDQPGSVWALLDDWLAKARYTAAGIAVPVSSVLVDSGFATSQVYRYTRKRASRRVYASKGIGGANLPIVGKPTSQGKERVLLYPIGVDSAKTEFLRSQLAEKAHGPGYVHLPDWMTSQQCDELVAERRFRRVFRGKVSYEWRKKRDDLANENLDCRLMARGALETLGARVIASLGARATARAGQLPPKVQENGDDPSAPDDAQQQRPAARQRGPSRSGWVNGWKR